jgi:hypothetical protein
MKYFVFSRKTVAEIRFEIALIFSFVSASVHHNQHINTNSLCSSEIQFYQSFKHSKTRTSTTNKHTNIQAHTTNKHTNIQAPNTNPNTQFIPKHPIPISFKFTTLTYTTNNELLQCNNRLGVTKRATGTSQVEQVSRARGEALCCALRYDSHRSWRCLGDTSAGGGKRSCYYIYQQWRGNSQHHYRTEFGPNIVRLHVSYPNCGPNFRV